MNNNITDHLTRILSREENFNKLKEILNSETNHDVNIYVDVEPNIKEIHAHSFVLSAHCQFFKNTLLTAKKENGYYIVKMPNIDELSIKTILKQVILLNHVIFLSEHTHTIN